MNAIGFVGFFFGAFMLPSVAEKLLPMGTVLAYFVFALYLVMIGMFLILGLKTDRY